MNSGRQSAPLAQRWTNFLFGEYSVPDDGEPTERNAEKYPLWHKPMVALVLFALIIAATGSALYLSAKQSVTQRTHDTLEGIARVKLAEVELWLDGHRKNVQLAINDPGFLAELRQWRKSGMTDGRLRERLREHLKRIALVGSYRDVGLRAALDGALLLSSGGREDTGLDRMHAKAAAKDMRPVFSDLHFVAKDSIDPGLDFYFPIGMDGMLPVPEVVAIQDDPTDFLFPLLARWPGLSPSAETLIFRTDGADVVYLNNPRHRADISQHFRLPISHAELLAATAARGQTGPLAGVDYRGIPSLGYALPVTGTSWLMITKVDANEVYSLLNSVAQLAAVAAILLVFLVALWIVEHGLHAETRIRDQCERQLLTRRIDFLSRYANDALILTDLAGVIVEVNERALDIYRYTRMEIIGMNATTMRAPHLREDLRAKMTQLAANECLVYETEILRKGGQVFPVDINARMIVIDDKRYFQWIVRDISERKAAVARIQRLSQLKAAISETNRAIIHGRSMAEVYQAVCQACVEHGNFRLAWLGLADPATQCINPVEVAGSASGYIDGIVVSTRADIPEGQGPSAVAYREQRVYICNDFFADPVTAPWCGRAAIWRLASSVSLPMLRGGRPYGTLNVYGAEKNLFDEEAVGLLMDMAQNISFAIDHFERDAQRRQAEHEVRQSEEKFRTLVEHLPQSICVKDSDLVYVSCNTVFARDVGVDSEQIAGRTDYDFFPLDVAEKYRTGDRRVMSSGAVEEVQEEYCVRGKRGFAHLIKVPIRNGQGQIVGVLGVFWDITESKLAERALRRYALEVEDLYQNAPCGYHSIAADGRLTRINDTELRWLGYVREEVVGRMSIFDLLSAISRNVFIESFRRFKQTGMTQELELEMVRKDGSIMPVMLSETAVFNADGRYVSSRTTVYDITERRKLEYEQMKQSRRLEELSHRLVAVQEEERRRLAGELHDRASPNLAAIKILLGTLAGMLPARVLAAADECLADTRALLDDTTVGIREICAELRPTVLDYAGLIPALEGYAEQFMKRTNVAVRFKASPVATRFDTTLESVLFRIAQEALTNCAKHACATRIDIEFTHSGRRVTLMIRDDGFGFDPDSLTASGNKPGLGLITMRERTEFVGGKFMVTSQPMKGTEIRVELENQTRIGSKHETSFHFECPTGGFLPGQDHSTVN